MVNEGKHEYEQRIAKRIKRIAHLKTLPDNIHNRLLIAKCESKILFYQHMIEFFSKPLK